MSQIKVVSSGFLQGGGEMGALVRALDWEQTPLGPVEQWPQSLLTTLSLLLNSKYPMFIFWGPQLVKIYNDGYRPITGAKHPWALGRPATQVWPEIWDDIKPLVDRALAGDATWSENLQLFMHRRGFPEEVYFTFSYSPVRDETGGVGGMFCACTETTSEVLGERRLQTLRDLAAGPAEARSVEEAGALSADVLARNPLDVPFALVYLLEDGGSTARLLTCAGAAAGPAAPAVVSSGEAGGWPVLDVASSRTAQLVEEIGTRFVGVPAGPWPEAPRSAMVLPLVDRAVERPLGAIVLGISARRPFDDEYRGWFDLVAGQIGASVTNARGAEEERRRIEALAALDRAKTAFFSSVSHEFRTPLTLLLGPLDEMRRDPRLAADLRQQVALAHRNATRLLRLVNTLLDFSRLQAGRINAAYEPVDLARLTADLASLFRSAIEKAGLRFEVHTPPLGEPVFVDRGMWEKIVLNLLSNAFKFTHEGSITVGLERRAGAAVLSISDTGVGVPDDELPRLFERFHRVAGARGRTHEGSGIGLSLVHELVALHGGRVEVGSRLGEGTTFTVSVPLGSAHLPAEHVHAAGAGVATDTAGAYVDEALRWLPSDTAEDGGESPVHAPELIQPATPRPRVLLADDNADMRDYVVRLLHDRWDTEAVGNGEQALAAIRHRRPDVILTDIMMPVLDGYGLLGALRADEATRDIPVILLSARAGEEARIEGLQAGADDYLVKPFSTRELFARVESQLLRARERYVERAHAQRMAAVFAQAPVAIAILRGPDHVFELANPPYLALVDNRQVVGLPVRAALSELGGQGFYELLDEVYASGEPYVGRSMRMQLSREPSSEREERFFDFVYQPMRDAEGRMEAIAVVAFDVTDLTRARRDAEVANRAKDEFLAMLGHELRNPLAPILTALQLMHLRRVEGGDKERRVIERQVGHLVSLVDDLLDVSRITRGKLVLRHVRVEIGEAIAGAIEIASPLLERQRHMLSVDVPPQSLAVVGDVDRLSQVVSNLLTNAAKYTEPEGRVAITARREGDEVVVAVTDNGMGIAPEMLPNVFDLFVQGRQAVDRSRGGLGLGLTIVRSLVEQHGGSVSAASGGPGQGSEFTIRLPHADRAETVPVKTLASHAIGHSARPQRVLLVDDNEDAATMLAETLTLAGHLVRTAHDGPEALRVAMAVRPQVAIVDIGLPVMDGYELARRLKDLPDPPRSLIALSGYGQPLDHERSARAGFFAHLVKPVDFEALRRTVDSSSAEPDRPQRDP